MVPFARKIAEFNQQQYRMIYEYCRNITGYAHPLGGYQNPISLPLALENPTKKLDIYCHKSYRLTENEATQSHFNDLLGENRTVQEDTSRLRIINLTKGLTFINNYLNDPTHGYEYLDRIGLYLQQNPGHKVKAFKKGRTVIITTNLDTEDVDARIFSALPLLFKTEFSWSDKAITYFKLAATDTPEAHNEMQRIYNEYTLPLLQNYKKKELERGLLAAVNYQKTTSIKKLKTVQDDISSYEKLLTALYKDERTLQAQIAFFEPTVELNDVTNYILNNKFIVDYWSHRDKALVVAVEAPLEYIDASALKKMLANPNSYLYPILHNNNAPASVKQNETEFILFLKDLFLTGKYKVYTRSEVVLDFEKAEAYPLRHAGNYGHSSMLSYKPTDWTLKNRYQSNPDRCITPHMHIEYYDCWTGNKTNIAKALTKSDIIGALDIIINTTKDINVNDSAVFGRFVRQGLYNPEEFRNVGRLPGSESVDFLMPGNQFKTIWDTDKKIFRTFDDIFHNDYLRNKAKIEL